MKRSRVGVLLALPLLLSGVGAQAATVDFTVVSNTGFGTETVAGDSISFAPSLFAFAFANSGNPSGGVTGSIAQGGVQLQITALGNNRITSVTYTEGGEYTITGPSGLVVATGFVRVGGAETGFVPFVGSGTTTTTSWPDISVTASLPSVQSVLVDVSNILVAYVSNPLSNDSAAIEKLTAGIEVTTQVVPIPPAVWLFGSALLGVGMLRRRFAA